MLVDYEVMLQTWPLLRSYFANRPEIQKVELHQLCQQRMPTLTDPVWEAGLSALVRNRLLYQTPNGFSIQPVAALRHFDPVVEPIWRQLWNTLQARLVLPMGYLWSTGWLRDCLPPHQLLLVLEVDRAELQQATRIVRDMLGYPLYSAEQVLVPADQPLLLRPRLSITRRIRVGSMRLACLEKVLVELPKVLGWSFKNQNRQVQHLLHNVQAQYNLIPEQLLYYAAHRGHSTQWQHLLQATAIEASSDST